MSQIKQLELEHIKSNNAELNKAHKYEDALHTYS